MSQTERKGKGATPNPGEEGRVKKKPSKKDSKDSDEHCRDCRKVISADTKALNCNFCFKWVCTSCLEVPDELYTVLVQNPKSLLLVPCKECSGQISSLKEMRDTLHDVKANQVETKEQLNNLNKTNKVNQDGTKKQLENLNKKMLSLSKDLQKTVKDMVKIEVDNQLGAKILQVEDNLKNQMDQRFKDIKKETQDSIAGQGAVSQDQIKDVVREAYKEEKMKEIKKPNLVLFNIPEKKTSDWRERRRNDMDMVLKVLRFLSEMENMEEKIVRVFRMGKWMDDGSIRPIKVIFADPDTKFKFLQKGYKLSESEDDLLKVVRVSPDRTPSEIQKHKELRKELENRLKNGESDLRIRKGKIVKISREEPRTDRSARDNSPNEVEGTVEDLSQRNNSDSEREADFSLAHGPEEPIYHGLFQVQPMEQEQERGTPGDPGGNQHV